MARKKKSLTVGDLIKHIRDLDPDMPVVIVASSAGVQDVLPVVDRLHKDDRTGHYSYFMDDHSHATVKHLILFGQKHDKD